MRAVESKSATGEHFVTTGDPLYRFESGDGYALIELLPALNDAPWNEIERIGGEILERLEGTRFRGLMVDLSALSYMGSAMMALVVRLWKSVQQSKKSMVVVNRDPMVLELLRIAKLDTIWTVVANRDEGFRHLGVASGKRAGAGGVALLAAGMTAVAGAVAGVGLLFAPSAAVPVHVAFWTAVGCAALGLLAGSVITLREVEAGRRTLGVVIIVASLASALAALLNMPPIA